MIFVTCAPKTESWMISDSTNSDYFAQPMSILVETIYGVPQKTTQLPGNVTASAPTQPLSMNMLDSLTVHAKMRQDPFSVFFSL